MSVQFGRWNIDGLPVDGDYLAKAGEMLAPYGPDGGAAFIKDNVGILYRAFHTTKESREETQPFVSPSGRVLCWDGRLDNREELVREFRETITADTTDLAIMTAAYEAWGTKCFAKLIGDWALSVWDPRERTLILAKDPIGTRHLYYSSDEARVTWSTILDPLVLLAGRTFALEEEYIAGWLSMFPATHLTPYIGIHAVPPSYWVLLQTGKHTVRKYWDFDPSKEIRYRTDAEYEEHFRIRFAQAVQRRLRSDTPVLAELSGGRDSSSIVCMADVILARGDATTPRLETISWYDDSEPNWNDRPYFTRIEENRGRKGWHIAVRSQGLQKKRESERMQLVPQSSYDDEIPEQTSLCLASYGSRVVLSGFAGDEITGGAPLPTPELLELLLRRRFGTLAHQLKAWALAKRKPWFQILLEATQQFLPAAIVGTRKHVRPPSWLQNDFVNDQRPALAGYASRVKLTGPLPSFQDNTSTLNALRRQLSCKTVSLKSLCEKRYPFLDRHFLEFMFAIPREQSVRPAQRRSLMRRALVDIVPCEILNRKTKAFIARAPLIAIANEWVEIVDLTQHMLSSSLGFIDAERFLASLQQTRRGQMSLPRCSARAIHIERWLTNLFHSGIVSLDANEKAHSPLRGCDFNGELFTAKN